MSRYPSVKELTAHARHVGKPDDCNDIIALAAGASFAVWQRNSHLGDARATEMGDSGELNVGQLLRQRHSRKTVNVGFTTYTGTVTAAWSVGPMLYAP